MKQLAVRDFGSPIDMETYVKALLLNIFSGGTKHTSVNRSINVDVSLFTLWIMREGSFLLLLELDAGAVGASCPGLLVDRLFIIAICITWGYDMHPLMTTGM